MMIATTATMAFGGRARYEYNREPPPPAAGSLTPAQLEWTQVYNYYKSMLPAHNARVYTDDGDFIDQKLSYLMSRCANLEREIHSFDRFFQSAPGHPRIISANALLNKATEARFRNRMLSSFYKLKPYGGGIIGDLRADYSRWELIVKQSRDYLSLNNNNGGDNSVFSFVYDQGATNELKRILEREVAVDDNEEYYNNNGGIIIKADDVFDLVCMGADPNVQNSRGRTGIFIGCFYNDVDLCKLFLSFIDTDVGIRDVDFEQNALEIAVPNLRNASVFDHLCDRAGNANIINDRASRYHHPALYAAILAGSGTQVSSLLLSGADPNLLGDPDRYPLHAACSFARICFIDLEKIKALVHHGANVNAKTIEKGMTALHYVSAIGLLDVVKFLVENGANVLARDKLGQTALDLCPQECEVVRPYLARAEHDYRERFMLLAGSIFKALPADVYRDMHTGPL